MAIELVASAPTAEELSRDRPLARAEEEDGAGVREETAEPSSGALEGLVTPPATSNLFSSEHGTCELHGRVVGIIRRNWRQYAGSLLPVSFGVAEDVKDTNTATAMDISDETEGSGGGVLSSTMLFVPVNKRIPRVLVATRRAQELSKSRLLVAIDHWPADSPYPQGHYVRVLGPAGSKEVETQVLLHEFDVPHEAFTPEVMACLPPAGLVQSNLFAYHIVYNSYLCLSYRLEDYRGRRGAAHGPSPHSGGVDRSSGVQGHRRRPALSPPSQWETRGRRAHCRSDRV